MTEPRRRDDPERSFQWFEPKRRRASLYEDVTIDSQPSINRHVGDREWPMFFEDGSGMWQPESTKLASADWYGFRDPGEMWERTYYQQGTAGEKLMEGAVVAARSERMLDDFTDEWVAFLRRHLQVPAFVEHGLWLALATAGRDCLSDTITHCVVLDAAMKQRHAQAIVLYGLDLDSHFEGFAVEPARQAWLGAEHWQPARSFLERLRTTTDWGERLVAANLCFEPLVGILLRRELLMRAPKWGGDAVTSSVGHVAQLEWTWIRDWTAELLRFVESDEKHGAANREVLSGWINDWLPEATAAADALEPLFADLPAGTVFEEVRGNVERDRAELFESAGVADLVGVTR